MRRELPRIDRPAEFRVALAEAHNLARDEVVELLAHPAGRAGRRPRDAHPRTRGRRRRGVPQQYLVELDREAALLDAELAWLDRLLARLTDEAMPWGIADIPEATLHRLTAHREAQRLMTDSTRAAARAASAPTDPRAAARGPPCGRSSSGSS